MSKLSDLEAKRAAKLQRLSELKDLRINESREFTQEEESEWDRTSNEVKTLNTQILREQEVEDLDVAKVKKRAAKESVTPEEKVMKSFSIARGLDSLFKKDRLTGIELEMKQEAEKELRDSKGPVSEIEGVGIPGFMLNMKGRNVIDGHKINRDLTVGGAASGAELVNEEYKGHIYGLTIAPKVIEMGATTLMGLVGTPKFSKSGTVTTTWEGENDANAEGSITTGEITMAPKRLGVYIDISKMLNAQTNGMANAIAIREIEIGMSVGLDAAAINGSGLAPGGILGMTDVNVHPLGTNGDVLTRRHLLGMKRLIAEDNALLSDLGFLTTAGVEEFLKDLPIDAGSGRFVWNEDSDKIIGYRAMMSNNVPDDLTKGGSTSICHAIILGCWNQLMIGNWGGLDIVIDPLSRSKEYLTTIVVNSLWDIKARHEQAFCVTKDVLVS